MIQNGEIIVFLGDSITAEGAQRGGYIKLSSKEIGDIYPGKNIKLIGAGVSGNKVPDCRKRLERDVLRHKPSTVVVYIGINDVWHWTKPHPITGAQRKGTTTKDYRDGIQDMITRIQAAGSRVIICTPSVISENIDPKDENYIKLDMYADICRKLAAENKLQLLDLRREFINYLKKHNPKRLNKGILTCDGVHLNSAGNAFVSKLMLEALRVKKCDAEERN